MAAPDHVPIKPTDRPRSYESPPWRAGVWLADRPAEVVGRGRAAGERIGSQGPDQGYVWKLVRQFDAKLALTEGLRRDDVDTGCVGVALKRASLFGRAPVIHDLSVAYTVWGFLDPDPPAELVVVRRTMFEGVANQNHYPQQRAIVDAVPATTLRRTPEQVAAQHTSDWRSLVAL